MASIISKYINEILEKVDEKKELIKQFPEMSEAIICFRGESENYAETKLMPSLFRNTSGILLEPELIELLSDYEIPDAKDATNLSKSIAGQHFVQTSRLLDITFSILPALYFASDINNKSGYIYSFIFPESVSPNSNYLNHYYDSIVNKEFTPYSKDFKVITHSYSNERIRMQSGGFILFSGEYFNKIPQEYYVACIEIPAIDKKLIRTELSEYFNLNESTLFPEKDRRRTPIINRLSTSKRHATDLDDYVNTELDYYLRRIKFELSLKSLSDQDSISLRRFLRKEKGNILNYVDENYSSEKLDEVIQKINYKFTIMEAGIRK